MRLSVRLGLTICVLSSNAFAETRLTLRPSRQGVAVAPTGTSDSLLALARHYMRKRHKMDSVAVYEMDMRFHRLGFYPEAQRTGLISQLTATCAKLLGSRTQSADVRIDPTTSAILRQSIDTGASAERLGVQKLIETLSNIPDEPSRMPRITVAQLDPLLHHANVMGMTGFGLARSFEEIDAKVQRELPNVLRYARMIGPTASVPTTYVIPLSHWTGRGASAEFILHRAGTPDREIEVRDEQSLTGLDDIVANRILEEVLSPGVVRRALLNRYYPGVDPARVEEAALAQIPRGNVRAEYTGKDGSPMHDDFQVGIRQVGATLTLDIENVGNGQARGLRDELDRIAHQSADVVRIDAQLKRSNGRVVGTVTYYTASGRYLRRSLYDTGVQALTLGLWSLGGHAFGASGLRLSLEVQKIRQDRGGEHEVFVLRAQSLVVKGH